MSRPLAAAVAGLATCPSCRLLLRPAKMSAISACPRCRAHVGLRKPASIARTCVLLVAAFGFYIPANMLPILVTEQLLDRRADTIWSGTVYLWVTGAWPLAIIVFVASILVPLAKLVALTWLIVCVQWRLRGSALRRVRVYRVIRTIGRWSMLDIFVAAMLAAAVQFKTLAAVQPASGAIAFAAVVVLTMLAVQTFDPRLVWDAAEARDG